jgi:YggT family protein
VRRVIGFVEESTDPFLNLFRRFIPRLGPLDVSPIVAIIVLSVLGGIAVNLVNG